MKLGPLAALGPLVALAASASAAEDAPQPASPALVWVTLLIPCLALVMLFFVLIRNRRTPVYLDRANQHLDRNAEHMARMEAKADRMIALLESIDRRLGE